MRVAQLNNHAKALYVDLGRLADSGAKTVGEPLSAVYNTLLEQAKRRFPQDAMIETLNPVTDSMQPFVVQALTAQLALVLGSA
jgi:hypothetical protein